MYVDFSGRLLNGGSAFDQSGEAVALRDVVGALTSHG